jgi:hypothetical protein
VELADTNDFNSDGSTDLLWEHYSGKLAIWDMTEGHQSGYHFLGSVGSHWSLADTGDYNGDAHADILWRHKTGAAAVWDIVDGAQVGYHFLGHRERVAPAVAAVDKGARLARAVIARSASDGGNPDAAPPPGLLRSQ